MKAVRRKNIRRRIRSGAGRFLAILFIVALGSGFMAGLAATSPDMLETADTYFDETHWYDVDLKSPLGFTDADADAVAALPGVGVLQCARVVDLVLDGESTSHTCRVYGLLDENGDTALNRVKLLEGRMPESASECVVQDSAGRYTDKAVGIGEMLTLSPENDRYETLKSSVTSDTLTVVGIVESPMSIAVMQEPTNVGAGSIGLHVFTCADYYDLPYYTEFYLSLSGAAALDSFSEEYDALTDAFVRRLEALGDERAPVRAETVRTETAEQIDALEQSLDALEAVADVSAELNEDALVRAAQTRETAALLKRAGSAALAKLLEQTAEAVESAGGNGEPPCVSKLRDGLAEARETLNSLDGAAWIVRTRSDSEGFASYDSNVSKVSALAKIFPLFFFLVALLVALTTMTRLVEENRTEIGTLKALGFSNGQILAEYLLYGGLTSVLGCILGFAVGFRLFPYAISAAYSMMYTLPDVVLPVRWNIIAWVAPVTVGSILLAAFWACYDEFRSCPAELMRPKAPKEGKRIWLEHLPFLWNRLSFSHKVTCRNLFRYQKRLIMTLLGVAGCTALLVTGFGLRDSIGDIVDLQFNEIYIYELTVVTDGETDEALDAFLADRALISASMPYHSEDGKVRFGGNSESAGLCVPAQPERFSDFVSLRERKTGAAVPFPETGAVLTEKLCETLDIHVGDTVTLEDGDGRRGEVTVEGVTENYLTSFAYLSPDTYFRLFGREAEASTLLCCYSEGADTSNAVARALESDHVIYASSSTTLKDTFADSINSINGVIWVLILAAGLLCMVVLFSLTNVNICERRKELATITVLGFHEREVESYIFRETNILSFLGSLCGLGVGVWLHRYVVRTVEVEQVMFGRTIYPLSYLYAVAISMVFTLLVNELLRKRIRGIDMVEAMKSGE